MLDDRFGKGTITSRIGLKADAHLFDSRTDIFANVAAEHGNTHLIAY